MNACLAIQHLCLAIENSAQAPLGSGPLTDRLRDAAGAVGIVDIVRGVGYDAFVEVQRIRDAIEHPKPDNTHRGGDDGSWDQVPMAWLLSERAEESFGQFFDWFDRVHDAWQAWVAAQPPVTQTLTVERGRKSLRQYKKPPRPAPEG